MFVFLLYLRANYSSVLDWSKEIKPQEINKWRGDVEQLVKEAKEDLLSCLPENPKQWRIEHVITWLAAHAPGLDSAALLLLKQMGLSGRALVEDFKTSVEPTNMKKALPYGVTLVTYIEIHLVLASNKLIATGQSIS